MPDWRAETRKAAQRHGLDPAIFERQIKQESGFNPTARSGAGALGIAQIMPATARGWGVNPLDPRAALNAAASHMASDVRKYGSYENALRAYNAGPGAIEKSKGYAETNNYVRTILGGQTPKALTKPAAGGGSDSSGTSSTTTTTPGVDNRQARAQLIQSFLSQHHPDPVSFALQARALQDVAPTSTTETTGSTDLGSTSGPLASSAASRANVINRQALPYKWGGGHGGQTKITDPVPLDCSGAVSKVLGIDPRVADQFKSWGSAGDGGNKGVTVYSKPTHVLMKINGHFFGTSATNPGGGAGWIPQSALSPAYLAGFTARHTKG